MFVSFINVFTQICKVGCQGVCAIRCWSLYAKLAFFIKLYLTLWTDFAACWCFWFSYNDSSIQQVCPLLV